MRMKNWVFAVTATVGINAFALSVDEFLPPVQAKSPEQAEELSKVNGKVEGINSQIA